MLNRIGSGLVMLTLMTVLAAGTSHAVSTMALTGPPGDLAPGSQFSVAVDIDFDQTTVGGSFSVDFDDTILQFVDIVYTAVPAPTIGFTCPGGANCPGVAPDFLALGNITGYNPGEQEIALLTFEVLPSAVDGSTTLTLMQQGNGFASDLGAPITVQYVSDSVNIVPEPSGGLLIGCGLLGLLAATAIRRQLTADS